MQPFEKTQNYKRIHQNYSALKTLPAKIRETELAALEAIMSNKNFSKIASAFQVIEDYFGQELTTADRPFVTFKLMEMETNKEEDEQLWGKMQDSIQKMQEVISSLDQQNTIICEKHKWLSAEIERYEASLPDIQEEIEIIQSQNQKLKLTPKSHPKAAGGQEELKQLLKYYRCIDRPFPKNKTEALMLVNRIQSMIQQLQMKKLSNYL